MWLEILVVALFILLGSVFVITEIAFVSLRESQIRQLAEQRGRRGRIVERLARDPNLFLAAAQIGVTFTGFLSAALGGATLEGRLSPVFEGWGLSSGVSEFLSLLLITMVIAYFSLVVGELVPKRIALQAPDRIALATATPLAWWSKLMRPVIWLLSLSTNVVVRILGGDPQASRGPMSEDELRSIVVAHEELDEEERLILDEVFTANDRALREIMVPRTEADFLDASTPVHKAIKDVASMPHSRYPVIRGSADDVVGFVHVRDLYDPTHSRRSVRVGDIARPVMMLPWSKRVLSSLSELRAKGQHLAIVVDEYGGTAGLVTFEDLVEELVGDIRDEYDADVPETRRVGEAVEVDGLLNLEDFLDETGVQLPDGPYETVAGFVMSVLGHVPEQGETVVSGGQVLEVVEVDGRRASRIRVTPTGGDPA